MTCKLGTYLQPWASSKTRKLCKLGLPGKASKANQHRLCIEEFRYLSGNLNLSTPNPFINYPCLREERPCRYSLSSQSKLLGRLGAENLLAGGHGRHCLCVAAQ